MAGGGRGDADDAAAYHQNVWVLYLDRARSAPELGPVLRVKPVTPDSSLLDHDLIVSCLGLRPYHNGSC